MVAARDPDLRATPLKLLREPLSWVAAAAVFGAGVGLFGTLWQASLVSSYDFDLSAELYAGAAQGCGQAIAALSLLAVPALIGSPRAASRTARWASRLVSAAGGVLLLAAAAASAAALYYLWYMNTGEMRNASAPIPPLAGASFWASLYLPPAVVVPSVVLALARRRWRLGALLSGLCVLALPFGLLWRVAPSASAGDGWLLGATVLGFLGWGVSLPEASLWCVLGAALFRAARGRSRGETERLAAEENLKRVRRLYEEGLGRGDGSVVDELVSDGFRDRGRGARGRAGMGRLIADLRTSYPDLVVCVEDQEAEGDLVRTRLTLSGTDRGSGVMWYPPTGKNVRFEAVFWDRFRGGRLVEHAGWADTEGLLRQLGHHGGEGRPGGGSPNF